MRRWVKFGLIAFVLTQPIAAGLMLWDLVHGRLPLHPFKRREAALLELRERARRYTEEHEGTGPPDGHAG